MGTKMMIITTRKNKIIINKNNYASIKFKTENDLSYV